MRIAGSALLACMFCVASAGAADAQGWVVTIGVQAESAPPYEGAGHNSIMPLPVIRLRPADRPYRFTPPDDGLSLSLLGTDFISLGPVGRFQSKRESKGSLAGLDPIDWAGELGAFVDVWPAPWLRGRVEIRKGVTGHEGWVGDAGLDLIYTGNGWDFSIGPRIGYGDAEYRDTYFGVTPAEAAKGVFIRTAYAPGGGIRYIGAEAAVSLRLTPAWQVIFDAGYHSLDDDLSKSPVVTIAGSDDQANAGVTITYTFGR